LSIWRIGRIIRETKQKRIKTPNRRSACLRWGGGIPEEKQTTKKSKGGGEGEKKRKRKRPSTRSGGGVAPGSPSQGGTKKKSACEPGERGKRRSSTREEYEKNSPQTQDPQLQQMGREKGEKRPSSGDGGGLSFSPLTRSF